MRRHNFILQLLTTFAEIHGIAAAGDARDVDCLVLDVGDKESFWMACELATIPYYFIGGYASAVGHVRQDAPRGRMLCEVPMHLLHLDHRGKPFWFNGSLYRDKNAQKEKKVWLNPQLWAADTGQWDLDCLLNIDAHGGVHDLSEDGYVKVYQDTVQEAKRTNAAFNSLI